MASVGRPWRLSFFIAPRSSSTGAPVGAAITGPFRQLGKGVHRVSPSPGGGIQVPRPERPTENRSGPYSGSRRCQDGGALLLAGTSRP